MLIALKKHFVQRCLRDSCLLLLFASADQRIYSHIVTHYQMHSKFLTGLSLNLRPMPNYTETSNCKDVQNEISRCGRIRNDSHRIVDGCRGGKQAKWVI